MTALTELWTFAVAWYNLPFTCALLAFLGLSALQFIGLGQDHDADADADLHVDVDHDVDFDHDLDVGHDLDLDHDLDVGHDLDLDHDLEVDHDLDLDHDVDVDHDLDLHHGLEIGHGAGHEVAHDVSPSGMNSSGWVSVLHFLGVGQAPVTMVLLVLLAGFGFFGWVMNGLALSIWPQYPAIGYGYLIYGVIMAVALGVGLVLTNRVVSLIAWLVPPFATTATPVSRLVGRRGRVTSPQVDAVYGQVKVRDAGGTLITVFAVVDPDQAPIPRDTQVILVEYHAARKVFIVVPSDL